MWRAIFTTPPASKVAVFLAIFLSECSTFAVSNTIVFCYTNLLNLLGAKNLALQFFCFLGFSKVAVELAVNFQPLQ